MPRETATLEVATPGRGFHEISQELQNVVVQSGVSIGLCHVMNHSYGHKPARLVTGYLCDRRPDMAEMMWSV